MTRAPSDICDAFGFCLVLERYGWSDLYIAHEGGTLNCRISAVFTDVAEELLKLCRCILDNEAESIALFDEPGGYLVSLTPDAQQQHTMLLVVWELRGDLGVSRITGSETIALSMRVKRKQLLGAIMAELWKADQFLFEPSFQKGRGTDFPRDQLIALNKEWDVHTSLGPSFLK
ncbi:hypothetical protein [Ensifer adhaerens]|uniref:hypothetical protein n=1 Tax=Ensifer adhaerens TaxID=106592 RepID=UPI001F2A0DDC|nr:hypothetical protein [Ensifer adhaerens]